MTIGEDLDEYTLRVIVTRRELVEGQTGMGLGPIIWRRIEGELGSDEAGSILWGVVTYHRHAERFAAARRKSKSGRG